MMHYTSAAVFEEVVAVGQQVLVQFSAPWCAPCRAIVPVITEIAKAYADKLSVIIVNIDEAPGVVARLDIRGIPFIQLFDHGVPVVRFTDAVTARNLSNFLDMHLQAA